METTEGWVYINETVTSNAYNPPPDDGISRVARPVMTLTKCNIHNFYVFTLVGSVVVLFGLIGNTLTISVLWRDRIKSATHFLLAVLAITDNLVLLSCWLTSAPLSFTRVYMKPKIYRNLVSVSYVYLGCLTDTSRMITISITMLVTWQRYLSVCLPHKCNTLASISNIKTLVLTLIIFSLLFNLPMYFEKRLVYDKPSPGLISFSDTTLGQSEAYNLWYRTFLYYVFFYVLPSLALIYMTQALIVGLKKISKRNLEMNNTLTKTPSNNNVQRNNIEVTLSIIIVVVTFMIFHFMAPVRRILLLFNPEPDGKQCGSAMSYMQPYVVLSIEISSAVNFIIYILCVKRFRENLIRMCKRGFRIEPHNTSNQGADYQRRTRSYNNDYPHTMQ